MRKSWFSEEQIIGVLKEVGSWLAAGEGCEKHGICDQTHLSVEGLVRRLGGKRARRLRQLEDENRRLKQMVED